MKIYIILKEDHGYLGYGRDIGNGAEIESIHKSLDNAIQHIKDNYKNPRFEPGLIDLDYQNGILGIYRWFNEDKDQHVYLLTIYEKELV